MERSKNEWEELIALLPEGWEKKARELGALVRGRNIKTAEELFVLLMTYIGNDASVQTTSTLFKVTMGIKLDKSAVFHRIKSSWKWLRWMAQELCMEQGIVIPKPSFLGERKVILIDASDEAVKGSKKSDYRLHYCFDLFGFHCRKLELTPATEGEKMTRHEARMGDIMVVDRIYCTISGIEHVRDHGGDYVVRFRSKAFHLYDEGGDRIELLSYMRHLKAYESVDIHCFYKLSTGQLQPIRIVAMRKGKDAEEEAKRKMERNACRKQEKPAHVDTVELNEYIVLATSLTYTNEQILELYRARWQIEQVFFRLKTLYHYDDVPCKNADTAKAWFYGKLLLSALCEKMIKREIFFPGGD